MYLDLKSIEKTFGNKKVVKNLNISLEKGKILCLLGPSGCGKTTTLKMIGGFLTPDKGSIKIDEEDITNLPPEKRQISTVFQSYALFPHMTVIQNVRYGLKFQGFNKKDAEKKAIEYLEVMDLDKYANSHISELSGGQQQRVALARALIVNPKLLLLDEPLSNLDAKLRIKMRDEIRNIQKKFNSTIVFVTHDQEEAMVLGDQIAIMNKGELIQVGSPEEIYTKPRNEFVQEFLGLVSKFKDKNGNTVVRRPEELSFVEKDGIQSGIVQSAEFLGFYRQYKVKTNLEEELIIRTSAKIVKKIGEKVEVL